MFGAVPKEGETMKKVSGSGPVPYHRWLFGALPLLFLTACATTREQPRDVGEVAQPVGFRTLVEMLGRIPGVRVMELPGGRLRVWISGTSSFISGQDPLILLDGVVIQSAGDGLSGINPNSIESITVLKHASETAIYGSRGANGVILIKTKTGGGAGLRN